MDDEFVNLEEVRDAIEEEWLKKDIIVRSVEKPNADTFVLIYQKHSTSVFITDRYFIEFRIGYTIFGRRNGYLFIFDSENNTSEFLLHNFARVPAEALAKLLSKPGINNKTGSCVT